MNPHTSHADPAWVSMISEAKLTAQSVNFVHVKHLTLTARNVQHCNAVFEWFSVTREITLIR